MAKKQTRRSVSIRGTTYDRVREYCEDNQLSMSEFVESRISAFFEDRPPSQPVKAPKPPPPKPTKATRLEPRSATRISQALPAAKKNGNGNGDDRSLSFDELQDAARYFTF